MRRATLVLLGVIVGLVTLVHTVNAAEKLGYVNLGRIFNEYTKTKDYDKSLTDREAVYNTERDKKAEEVKQLQDKLALLSDKEKESKKQDIENKIKALQDFDREKQTDLRKEFNEKRAEILKDIDTAVKDYSEKEGYSLVFNEAGVLYNAKALDITDKLLSVLNSKKDTKK